MPSEVLVRCLKGVMRCLVILIVNLASYLGINAVNLEQGIDDKDIPEERVGEDSSGGVCENFSFISQYFFSFSS